MPATARIQRRQTVNRQVKLSSPQSRFRHGPKLYRGFVGGRGSGKTWAGAYDMLCRSQPGRTYLIASPTGVLMGDTTFPTFEKLAKELGLWGSVKLSPYPNVTLSNGATIRFRTAENPEKLRGPNLSGVWLDETSLMEEEAYLIAIACLREQGKQGWLSATFTPKGLTHWTYEVFGKDRPNTEIFQASTRDNPFNPPGFHDTLAQQYTGLRAAQELEGKFVAVEGAEWPPEYFPDSLWFDDWPPELKIKVLALDPSKGITDTTKPKAGRDPDDSAFVMAGLSGDGKLWIEGDLDNHRDTSKIVDDGLRILNEWQPQAFAIEVNQFQSMLADAFRSRYRTTWTRPDPPPPLPIYGITNTVPKIVRIRTLGPYLARGELRFKRTPGTKRLWNQLRDFPVCEHDDGPDALEMCLRMIWFLLGKRERGAPQLLRA